MKLLKKKKTSAPRKATRKPPRAKKLIDLNALRAECEQLCKSVAPDLCEPRLYLVWQRELPVELRDPSCGGKWAASFDLVAREAIGSRWNGRGTTLIVDVPRRMRGDSDKQSREWTDLRAKAVALHELAHEGVYRNMALEQRALPAEAAEERASKLRAGLIKTARSATKKISRGEPTFDQACQLGFHHWQFVRLCLHFSARALHLRECIPALAIHDAAVYGLTDTDSYFRALGDEPWRMESATVQEITATPPPAEFQQLWQSDISAWLARQTEESTSLAEKRIADQKIINRHIAFLRSLQKIPKFPPIEAPQTSEGNKHV